MNLLDEFSYSTWRFLRSYSVALDSGTPDPTIEHEESHWDHGELLQPVWAWDGMGKSSCFITLFLSSFLSSFLKPHSMKFPCSKAAKNLSIVIQYSYSLTPNS